MHRNERIGTAHRVAVLENLSKALEQGYLELGEYEQRMMAVQSAKTINDLLSQVVDLPAEFQWNPQNGGSRQAYQVVNPGQPRSNAPLALGLGIASVPVSVCFGIGLILGGTAIFLGRQGLKSGENFSYSLVGIIMGAVGVVFSLFVIGIMIFGPETASS
ncbi:DUF1707 domain-containing protein [Micromonospora sp. NPDC018662]|uniref:DUF1707 domain-containing protein n=1 Tax=Micromonospora sp. NPDC018662 TaxID=3364238 RepID=UPI0037A45D96